MLTSFKKSNNNIVDITLLWKRYLLIGIILWIFSIIIMLDFNLDRILIFAFNQHRIDYSPIIQLANFFTNYGMSIIVSVLIFYLIANKILKNNYPPVSIIFYTITSFGLAGIAGDLIKEIISRPRPVTFFAENIHVISLSQTFSFPSGHTTKCVSLILPFIFFIKSNDISQKIIKSLFIVITFTVSASRLLLGAHFLSDIIAGVGTAFIFLPLTVLFSNMVLKNTPQEYYKFLFIVWIFLLIFLLFVLLLI